jgi:hypothetical protein
MFYITETNNYKSVLSSKQKDKRVTIHFSLGTPKNIKQKKENINELYGLI